MLDGTPCISLLSLLVKQVHLTSQLLPCPAWQAVPSCAMLCCAVLCCAVLCCAVLCCAVLCCAVLCCAALRCAVMLPTLMQNLALVEKVDELAKAKGVKPGQLALAWVHAQVLSHCPPLI